MVSDKNLYQTSTEQTILGALILSESCWTESRTLGLRSRDFFHNSHKRIYETICNLRQTHNDIFDLNFLMVAFRERGYVDNVKDADYLEQLTIIAATEESIRSHITIVKKLRLRRQVIAASQKAIRLATDDYIENNDLLNQIQPIFNSLYEDEQHKEWVKLSDSLQLALELALIERKGIVSGYRDVDKIIGNFDTGSLNIIAARPSMGKTALALNILSNYIRKNTDHLPVLFYSLEMSVEQLALRMISSCAGIDSELLTVGSLTTVHQAQIRNIIELFKSDKTYFSDSGSVTFDQIKSYARKMHLKHKGLSMIFIDYLSLISSTDDMQNRNLAVSEISRNLKLLAQELSVPILLLSQLNRKLEDRIDKRPILSDLRDSGAIEQDADKVIFIYRESVYDSSLIDKEICEIIVSKNRHGPTGKCFLRFIGARCRFASIKPKTKPQIESSTTDYCATDDELLTSYDQ